MKPSTAEQANLQNVTNSVRKKNEDVVKILSEDISLAHSSVPFLPLPVAIMCCILNTILPGTGKFLDFDRFYLVRC